MAKSRKTVRATKTTSAGPGRATSHAIPPLRDHRQRGRGRPEKRGLSYEDGVAIAVTLVLLAAILLLDYVRGTGYGAGMFFK
jgi:hypothetical protein